jgi:uncharacterized protein (DUF302 family)
MTATTNPREILFNGVRLRFDSQQPYDHVVTALLADVGEVPLDIDSVGRRFDDWESYRDAVQSHVGPSGFILFVLMNHGQWIGKAGISQRVLRLVIGNPLIAITMLRHDVTAGLFAPVELLVVEEADGHGALIYVRPSSLMVVEPNPELLAAARTLDDKLQALATKVTNGEANP